jgi:hypothetical protein
MSLKQGTQLYRPVRLSIAFRTRRGPFPGHAGKFYAELTQVSMSKLWVHSVTDLQGNLRRCGQAVSNRNRLSNCADSRR